MTEREIRERAGALSGWRYAEGKLHKEYRFPDFGHAFGFMAAAAVAIEKMDHHPEWTNVWNKVTVSLTTHDAGGVTGKDFELAGLLDSLAVKLQ